MASRRTKVNALLRAMSDAIHADDMITNGLGAITIDEFHAFEEGLNSNA